MLALLTPRRSHLAIKITPLVLIVVLAFVDHAAAPTVAAQQASKVARVGVLAGGGDLFRAGFESFRERLRELGFVENQTIAFFVRTAEGRAERCLSYFGLGLVEPARAPNLAPERESAPELDTNDRPLLSVPAGGLPRPHVRPSGRNGSGNLGWLVQPPRRGFP